MEAEHLSLTETLQHRASAIGPLIESRFSKKARSPAADSKKAPRWTAIGLALLALLSEAEKTWAQGPPINTDTAFVTGLQGAALRSFFFSVRRSGLLQDGRRISDPLDRKVSVFGLPLILPYEVLKNQLVVIGGIPILHKEMKFTAADGTRRKLSDTGFGDLFVVAKYQLLQKDAPGKQPGSPPWAG